jgi:STE24 endopeptidase
MNFGVFAWILLGLYLALQGFEAAITRLNLAFLRSRRGEVPEAARGFIDPETLSKAQDYLAANTRHKLVAMAFNALVLVGFVYSGLLPAYGNWISSFRLPFVAEGLLFFLLLSLAEAFIGLPFDIAHEFGTEKRFGFSRMTPGLFAADFLKSLILSAFLVSALAGGALFLVKLLPGSWWIAAWVFYFAFTLLVSWLAPMVIMPLFNKFEPLKDEELAARAKALLERAGIRVEGLYQMDASKRSGHTNAYFTGLGKTKRIVLFDTLLSKLDHDEILAVLAHEAGHWKKKHVFKSLIAMGAVSLAVFYAVFALLGVHVPARVFGIADASFFTELFLLGFAGGILGYIAGPIAAFFSRKNEREADAYSKELTGNGKALASSLWKLSRDNLGNLHPHPLYVAVHYSHPPTAERAKLLED